MASEAEQQNEQRETERHRKRDIERDRERHRERDRERQRHTEKHDETRKDATSSIIVVLRRSRYTLSVSFASRLLLPRLMFFELFSNFFRFAFLIVF